MFKGIDAWRLDLKWELASNAKENDETKLIDAENRITGVEIAIAVGCLIGCTLLIAGIGFLAMFYGVFKSVSDSSTDILKPSQSSSNKGVTTHPDAKIRMALCTNGNLAECPIYLQNLIIALAVCRGVDEEDLAQRLMRRNVDLAILRETVMNNPESNGSNHVPNAIM